MKCTSHPKKDAAGICTVCGSPFCSDCLIQVKRKNICVECASSKIDAGASTSESVKESESKPMAFPQQQQQQQQPEAPKAEEKPAPSKFNFDIIKWIIAALMFVTALGAFSKLGWGILSGMFFFALGIYWIPPIMAGIQRFIYEKAGISLPRWFRIGISLFLFFLASMIMPRGV